MSNPITSEELANKWFTRLMDKINNPESNRLIETGLVDLDKHLGGGIDRGQMVVIGGKQKSGKTTLALNILARWNKAGLRTLFISGEMNDLQFGDMLFASESGVLRQSVRNVVELTVENIEKLSETKDQIAKWPGYWHYGLNTVEELEQLMLNSVEAGFPFDVLSVDYMQLMNAPQFRDNRAQAVAHISRGLKRITLSEAFEPKPIVLAIAQLNRLSRIVARLRKLWIWVSLLWT
jgi:replicative DNA helicase